MELDLDHIQAYCPYCGQKLYIDLENLHEVLIEKEKTKQKLAEIDLEKENIDKEIKLQKEKSASEIKFFLILLIICFLMSVSFFVLSKFL